MAAAPLGRYPTTRSPVPTPSRRSVAAAAVTWRSSSAQVTSVLPPASVSSTTAVASGSRSRNTWLT